VVVLDSQRRTMSVDFIFLFISAKVAGAKGRKVAGIQLLAILQKQIVVANKVLKRGINV